MRKSDFKKPRVNEGLADLAGRAEQDHEVQMARAELYKIAKHAIKLHEMLKGVSEETGLEGWVQSKITKAADYIDSVYHHLDYETKFEEEITTAVETSDYKNALSKKLYEKAESKSQQRLMAMALAYKRGESKTASDEVKKLASSMSEKELEDFAKTKHKGLPDKVDEGFLDSILGSEERDAAEKTMASYLKGKTGDKTIAGRIYAYCNGDYLECMYSYMVEKGIPSHPKIDAIVDKFELEGNANMQMDD